MAKLLSLHHIEEIKVDEPTFMRIIHICIEELDRWSIPKDIDQITKKSAVEKIIPDLQDRLSQMMIEDEGEVKVDTDEILKSRREWMEPLLGKENV